MLILPSLLSGCQTKLVSSEFASYQDDCPFSSEIESDIALFFRCLCITIVLPWKAWVFAQKTFFSFILVKSSQTFELCCRLAMILFGHNTVRMHQGYEGSGRYRERKAKLKKVSIIKLVLDDFDNHNRD